MANPGADLRDLGYRPFASKECRVNTYKLLASILLLLAASAAHAQLITVNSSADPGDGVCNAANCTLREAILASNGSTEFSTVIDFNIPGSTTHTISLLAPLPTITRFVRILGFTQPGAVAPTTNPFTYTIRIQLDGSQIPDSGFVSGLHVSGTGNFDDVEISGIAFGNFARAQGDGVAIWIQDARIATIGSNHIGLSADGSLVTTNDIGVRVDSARDSSLGGNVISGNRVGVLGGGRRQPGRTGLSIAGNRIGTNRAGTQAIPNSEDGIRIVSGCAAPAGQFRISGNLVSGNGRDGIHLTGETIGCNLMTGTFPAEITANRVGLAATGSAPIGNGRHGVAVGMLTTTSTLQIGSPVAGVTPENRNTIGFNGGAGVAVFDGAGGIVMRENTYLSNVGAAIDLGADGPSPNDSGDADNGPNRRMNFPELGALQDAAGGAQLTYRVSSIAPHATYGLRVDFYTLLDGALQFRQSEFYATANATQTVTLANLGEAQVVAMVTDDSNGPFEGRPSHSSEFSAPALRSVFGNGFESP
jgi:CSLREA domain-containing protein